MFELSPCAQVFDILFTHTPTCHILELFFIKGTFLSFKILYPNLVVFVACNKIFPKFGYPIRLCVYIRASLGQLRLWWPIS